MSKVYALTKLKDGVYQEIDSQELEEFFRLCPVVANMLVNPDLVN